MRTMRVIQGVFMRKSLIAGFVLFLMFDFVLQTEAARTTAATKPAVQAASTKAAAAPPAVIKPQVKTLFSGKWSIAGNKVNLESPKNSSITAKEAATLATWKGKLTQVLVQLGKYNPDQALASNDPLKLIQGYYQTVLSEMQSKGVPLFLATSRNIYTSYGKTFTMPPALRDKINKAYATDSKGSLSIDIIIGGRKEPKAFVMINPGPVSAVEAMRHMKPGSSAISGSFAVFPQTALSSSIINSLKKFIGIRSNTTIDIGNIATQMMPNGSTSAVLLPYGNNGLPDYVVFKNSSKSQIPIVSMVNRTVPAIGHAQGLAKPPGNKVIFAGNWSVDAANKVHMQSSFSPFDSQENGKLFAEWMPKMADLLKQTAQLDVYSDPVVNKLKQSQDTESWCKDMGGCRQSIQGAFWAALNKMKNNPLSLIGLSSSENAFAVYEHSFQILSQDTSGNLCHKVDVAYGTTNSNCWFNVALVIGGQPDPVAYIMLVPGNTGAVKAIDQPTPPDTLPGTLFTLSLPRRLPTAPAPLPSAVSQIINATAQKNSTLPQPPGGGIAAKAQKDARNATGPSATAIPPPRINIRTIANLIKLASKGTATSVRFYDGMGNSFGANYPLGTIDPVALDSLRQQAEAAGGEVFPSNAPDKEARCRGNVCITSGDTTIVVPPGKQLSLGGTTDPATSQRAGGPTDPVYNNWNQWNNQTVGNITTYTSPDGKYEVRVSNDEGITYVDLMEDGTEVTQHYNNADQRDWISFKLTSENGYTTYTDYYEDGKKVRREVRKVDNNGRETIVLATGDTSRQGNGNSNPAFNGWERWSHETSGDINTYRRGNQEVVVTSDGTTYTQTDDDGFTMTQYYDKDGHMDYATSTLTGRDGFTIIQYYGKDGHVDYATFTFPDRDGGRTIITERYNEDGTLMSTTTATTTDPTTGRTTTTRFDSDGNRTKTITVEPQSPQNVAANMGLTNINCHETTCTGDGQNGRVTVTTTPDGEIRVTTSKGDNFNTTSSPNSEIPGLDDVAEIEIRLLTPAVEDVGGTPSSSMASNLPDPDSNEFGELPPDGGGCVEDPTTCTE